MDLSYLQKIIEEELDYARERIIDRYCEQQPNLPAQPAAATTAAGPPPATAARPPLPANPNYAQAQALYQAGGSHSGVASKLGVSISKAKNYYNWLVINGYLPTKNEPLSAAEQVVVDLLYRQGLSISEAARKLGCSATNISYRRDSARRKGYQPPAQPQLTTPNQP